jgi:signal recognition particle subunit SRP19
MSRRAAVVEEFDDDTDLPLPSMPLPNTGLRGPILQDINDDSDDDDDLGTTHQAGPASPPRQQPFSHHQRSPPDTDDAKKVTDITPYKTWTCIYPIYLDAKRPYGQRRVSRAKGLWWPLSKDIADAANRLGLGTLHEVTKAHPRDWENPGRVRVQWKKDGKLVNPVIKTKKQLFEMICYQLQLLKPENIPKPPYNLGKLPIPIPPSQKASDGPQTQPPSSNPTPTTNAPKGKVSGGKHKTTQSHQGPVTKRDGTDPSNNLPKPVKRRVPIPPDPYPPLSSRLSAYSPVVASGMLIDTVKAGMSAQAEASSSAAGANMPGGMAKGKRKVVRVRQ